MVLALFTIQWGGVPARASVAGVLFDARNQVYSDPALARLQAGALFLNGHSRPLDSWQTAGSGAVDLARSTFGQPFLAAMPVREIHCREATEFDDWLIAAFGEASVLDPEQALSVWGWLADPDGDRLNNLLEFSAGTDPSSPDVLSLLQVWMDRSGDEDIVLVQFNRRAGAVPAMLHLSVSTNLLEWVSADLLMTLLPVERMAPGLEKMTYAAPFDREASGVFFRLAVSAAGQPPPPSVEWESIDTELYGIVGETVVLNFMSAPGDPAGCIIGEELLIYRGDTFVARLSGGNRAWSTLEPGAYRLVARAWDARGIAGTSLVRTLTVDHDCDGDRIPDALDPRRCVANVAPMITAWNISATANFHSAGVLRLSASAVDPDGDRFSLLAFADAVPLGELTGGSLEISGHAVSPGLHRFRLRALDRWGAASEAQVSRYLFRQPPLP